jgi:collagenase-like PrtC family protease
VNGIQTLSHDYLNLAHLLLDLRMSGIARFRLSPHTCDMVMVATIFRSLLDQRIAPEEGMARLDAMALPFSDGFYQGKPGHSWTGLRAD